MKYFFLSLIILIGIVLATLSFQHDPGYVLIAYDVWTLESPLWFAILCVTIGVVILASIGKIIFFIIGSPSSLKHWYKRRHLQKTRSYTLKGLLALTEGQWKTAEQALLKGIDKSSSALLNYLGCAKAAQEQHLLTDTKRDEYLKLAHEVNPAAEIVIGLTQARLQLEKNQLVECLTTLKYLHQLSPNHSYVLKLLMQVYVAMEAWEELLLLTDQLLAQNIITAHQEQSFKINAYQIGLSKLTLIEEAEILAVWQHIPKEYHQAVPLLKVLIPKLLPFPSEAIFIEKLIRETTKKNWDDELIRYYAQIKYPNNSKLLSTTEHWLKQHPDNPSLLLTIGEICLNAQMWGKAQQFFEHSLRIKPTAHACFYLAELHAHLDEIEKSQHYYKEGLTIALQE